MSPNATKAPRSSAFPTGGDTTQYGLSYIDKAFWRAVQANAADEGISVRTLILTLLRLWLDGKVKLPKRPRA